MNEIQPQTQSKNSILALKLFVIAFIIVPLNSLWVIDTGIIGHGVNYTRVSLFMNTIFIISALSLLNIFLKNFLPKFTLSKTDLLLLYSMLCVSSAYRYDFSDYHRRIGSLLGISAHSLQILGKHLARLADF